MQRGSTTNAGRATAIFDGNNPQGQPRPTPTPAGDAITELRLKLLKQGYLPIPDRGKLPAMKGWNTSEYAKKEITAERIPTWIERFPEARTTGYRLQDRGAAIDIDCNDQAMVETLLEAVRRIAPDVWARAPRRHGGGVKLALFPRLVGRDFVRRGSFKYRRPTDPEIVYDDQGTPRKIYHHVECFGGQLTSRGRCSRQFAIDGPRKYNADDTVESWYQWAPDRPALHEIACADLPTMTIEQMMELLDVFEAEAQARSWIEIEEPDPEGDGTGDDIFDIDRETTRFDIWHGAGAVDYEELEDLVLITPDLRVSPEFMPGVVTERPDRCSVFWSERYSCAYIKDWKTNARHYPKDYAPVDCTAFGEKLKAVADKLGLKIPKDQPPIETPNWRERFKNGWPKPSLENARRAIKKLGVVLRYNEFNNQPVFEYKNDAIRSLLGDDLNDLSIMALRQMLSATFGIDFTERHVRDAAMTWALAHRFNPVVDLLAEAETNWDGKARLDRMAADYLNAENTKLNAAFIRKMMIAGVERARIPGCKFDNIVVLEGPQGWNKSSAWRVLAMRDEWFSDAKIIGKEGREVQEQLGDIWIHENADLAGMKKADVEIVKDFASRQVDRARPAYGHFVKRQPRHSIEAGTTNAATYLMSQDGNRRFWPMTVLKEINLNKLIRDRMQLWGEAAHYQSQGESLVLDRKLWKAAAVEQEARRVTDAWEDILARLPPAKTENGVTFGVVHLIDGQERVKSVDLLERVLQLAPVHQTTATAMRLATVMRVLGWERTKNRLVAIGDDRVSGYFRTI
jgi:predicted P-loop ATPase